jgi:hypothetical protein
MHHRFGYRAAVSMAAISLAASGGHAQGFTGPYAHDQWTSSGILGGTTVIRPAVRIESAAHCLASGSVLYFNDIFSAIPAGTTFDLVQRFLLRGTAPNVQYALVSTGLLGLPNIIVANNAAYSRTDAVTSPSALPSTTLDVGGSAVGGGTVSLASTLDLVNFGPGYARPFPVGALATFPGGAPSRYLASPTEIYLGYDVVLAAGGVSGRSASFSAVAPCSGIASFDWAYNGYHAFFQAFTSLEVFSELACGEAVQTLVPNMSVAGTFTFSGVVTIPVEAGAAFGVRVSGGNFDADSRIIGTVRLFNFTACVPEPASDCPGDANGNGVVNFADITSVLANFNLACP